MKKIVILLILLGSCGLLQAQNAESSATDERAKAQSAWEALIKAKGGRERLNAIDSFLRVARLSSSPLNVVSELHVFPDKLWHFAFYNERTPIVLTIEGNNRILRNASRIGITNEQHDFSLPDSWLVERALYLLETKHVKPEAVRVARTKVGKETFDVIQTNFRGYRTDFYYEPESMLVVRAVLFYETSRPVYIYEFRDYTLIDGIEMPQLVRMNDKHGGDKHYWPVEFKFNVDYDPAIFTEELRATGPDGWKRRPVP